MENPKKWLAVFPALDNVKRFNILIWLVNEGSKSFSQVRKKFSLSSANTRHHLDKLMQAQLIINSYKTPTVESREYSFYKITDLGKTVMTKLIGDTE